MSKTKKYLTLLSSFILIFSMSIRASASSNNDSISKIMEDEIEVSTILDKNNYTVRKIGIDEIPKNVVPLQFDTVEEAMAYLEEFETTTPLEEAEYGCITEINGNPKARAKKTYNCKYERKLTSCYTLYATVDVDDVTKKISNTYNMKFELSGVTIGIGIDNVDIKSTYYNNNTEVRIRAEYQHITYMLVETSALEVARSNCYQQMYYTYDDGCHDGEFGYR